ncbi:MAG: hypothetical protein KC492_44870 [Myxococcales bacterium]|nr:hypothetical protein [Myxococcales bacterium]
MKHVQSPRRTSHFPATPSDQELLEFVGRWIDLLAAGEFAAAYRATDHDPYYQWSPDLIRAVIQGYGLPDPEPDQPIHHVTARAAASGGPPQREVLRDDLPPPAIAEVVHDLPLSGVWSDLTATFRVEALSTGYSVVLQEIHVF